MNVSQRGKLALVLLLMSLASVCYALKPTNGWGVGLNCHTKYPGIDTTSRNNFNACCAGGCGVLYDEATQPAQYDDCTHHAYKCEDNLAQCAVNAGVGPAQPIIVQPK